MKLKLNKSDLEKLVLQLCKSRATEKSIYQLIELFELPAPLKMVKEAIAHELKKYTLLPRSRCVYLEGRDMSPAECVQNMLQAIGAKLWYNVRLNQPILYLKDKEEGQIEDTGLWVLLTTNCIALPYTINQGGEVSLGKIRTSTPTRPIIEQKFIKPCLKAATAKNQKDDFLDWLESLPKIKKLPKNPVICTISSECFKAQAVGHIPAHKVKFLWEEVFFKHICANVKRAYEPGAKYDLTPCLVGRQGIGKTEFLKQMLPPEHRVKWFGGNFNLNFSSKERVEYKFGKVILETAESLGSKLAERASIKALITNTTDTYRTPYDKHPKVFKERTTLAITSNHFDELPFRKYEEARRFPVVKIDSAVKDHTKNRDHIVDIWNKKRDKVWAEAIFIYKSGKLDLQLSQDAQDILNEMVGEVGSENTDLKSMILQFTGDPKKFFRGEVVNGQWQTKSSPQADFLEEIPDWFYFHNLLQWMRLYPGNYAQHEVEKILRYLGWYKREAAKGVKFSKTDQRFKWKTTVDEAITKHIIPGNEGKNWIEKDKLLMALDLPPKVRSVFNAVKVEMASRGWEFGRRSIRIDGQVTSHPAFWSRGDSE